MNWLTEEKLRSGPSVEPQLPHVVILGAGASKAALPEGDKFGKPIPLMDDLADIAGTVWKKLLREAKPPTGNFEATFSWIKRHGGFENQLLIVERRIENFFCDLQLPEHATIYDYLVLGLRPKDTIATFNWDPFLLAAHKRNHGVAELPDIRFLHGCVTYTNCQDHDILGTLFESCPSCLRPLERVGLIFPEEEKDYAKDALIKREWDSVTARLKKAFHLTIFGYSGPATDHNARRLLLESWRETPIHDICHAEIIDIRDDETVRNTWAEYFPHHHEMLVQSFWDCSIAKWPRRTADWKICASFYGMGADLLGPFRTQSLRELQEWFRRLAAAED
jgi:hypothetical protein